MTMRRRQRSTSVLLLAAAAAVGTVAVVEGTSHGTRPRAKAEGRHYKTDSGAGHAQARR
eukprot:CAMPEP_0197442876 /NCGR_PEP_ID=MMETSP1175-20131217/8783_1 /TAXON_ID=1003142 /ORGANISM="Triceratium dubium, Strain CCMP147" /LENGTH=58 /DNA_ID=CAMNT_0042973429 /DNA_START=111 /DNA_END=283 /DNA_ORIENTATION=-